MTGQPTLAVRPRILTVRVVFFVLVAFVGCWYWSGKITGNHWTRRTVSWYTTLLGVSRTSFTKYDSSDAAGDWVARAVSVGLFDGFDDPRSDGLDYTPARLDAETLRDLYQTFHAASLGTSTPMTFEHCDSPEIRNVPQTERGWMCLRITQPTTQLLFHFRQPIDANEMPRLAVFARPPEAFVDTPVFMYWSGDILQEPFTERRRSMSACFVRQGDDAFALLPLGRLVEWGRASPITDVRIDLQPRRSQGRLRVLALPLAQ